jgi:hypothetical protein
MLQTLATVSVISKVDSGEKLISNYSIFIFVHLSAFEIKIKFGESNRLIPREKYCKTNGFE